jgi:hypothetical protein
MYAELTPVPEATRAALVGLAREPFLLLRPSGIVTLLGCALLPLWWCTLVVFDSLCRRA